MRVQWSVFDNAAYARDNKAGIVADLENYRTYFEGDVLDKYQTFWGTPKFVILLDSGEITTIEMIKCKVIMPKT